MSDYYIATIEPSNPKPTSLTQILNNFFPNIDIENFEVFEIFREQSPIFETSTYPSTTSTHYIPTSTEQLGCDNWVRVRARCETSSHFVAERRN